MPLPGHDEPERCLCVSPPRSYKRAREREGKNVGRYIVRQVPNSTETHKMIIQRCESKSISFSLTYTHILSFPCKFRACFMLLAACKQHEAAWSLLSSVFLVCFLDSVLMMIAFILFSSLYFLDINRIYAYTSMHIHHNCNPANHRYLGIVSS